MKIALLIATILSLFAFTAQAAHLAVEDGGIWGQADRYISDTETEIPWSAVANSHLDYAFGQAGAETEYSFALGTFDGNTEPSFYWPTGGILVQTTSRVDCGSTDSGATVETYATCATLAPAQTDGIFLRVEADEGETVGMRVRIYWHWYAESYGIMGDASASIGNGGVYLTRGVEPPTGIPASDIVWWHDEMDFTGYGWDEDGGSFIASVGDVIGIFMTTSANASATGGNDSYAEVISAMELSAGETLGELWELPYAPGLVYDPAQNITFLKDWSACGTPMNWYDATQWASDFEYTSGDVTYTNWRLSVTTDESGVPAGELGFLATHCGISDTYSGPFTNVTDGDYWTAPLFPRDPDPAIAYAFTFSTTYGPAQWDSLPGYECYVIPVFDGMPQDRWCPADFDNNGIVDFVDFAVFASWWLHERPGLPM